MNNLNWLDGLPEKTPEIIKRGLILPQLPQHAPEKLGQLEPNKDAVPQLPQPAPTQNNGYRAENAPASSGEGVAKEANSATEKDTWASGFLTCWQLLLQGGLLVHPAQQAGQDCQGCKHMTMTTECHPGTRRKFFWRCDLGHRQMETGFAGQRVIIAPSGCSEYQQPGGW